MHRLRAAVLRGARRQWPPGDRGGALVIPGTEVQQHRLSIRLADEDVPALHVPMQHPGFMYGVQGLGERAHGPTTSRAVRLRAADQS